MLVKRRYFQTVNSTLNFRFKISTNSQTVCIPTCLSPIFRASHSTHYVGVVGGKTQVKNHVSRSLKASLQFFTIIKETIADFLTGRLF